MRPRYIRELAKILSESNVSEIEVRTWFGRVRISKDGTTVVAATPAVRASEPVAAAPAPAPVVEAAPTPPSDDHLIPVRAPMVGTFYRAPAPDAPPYVDVGTRVSKGAVLCIVEAMKLMNEIESEHDGVVRRIMVENGKPVEFGQTLFLIEP